MIHAFAISENKCRTAPVWIKSLRYVSPDKRDLRIDLLRGIALVMMVVAHIEVMSVLDIFTWERFGLTTGAEGFVILSGFMLGVINRQRLQKEALLTVSYALYRRACKIYIVNIVIIISILLLTKLTFINTFEVTHFTDRFSDVNYSLYPVYDQIKESWFNMVLYLQIGPHQSQILGLYFYLLLATPFFLYLLERRWVGWLLILSLSLYILYFFTRIKLTSAQFEFAFPFLAWQLIYVLGMTIGWYKEELLSLARTKAGFWSLCIIVSFTLIMMFIAQNHNNPFMPYDVMLHVINAPRFNWFYENFAAKNALGPLRVMNDFSLLITCYLILSYLWVPINKIFGWFLITLGQHSLYVFIVHIYVVLLVNQIVDFGLWHRAWLLNTLVHLCALLMLWLLAKYNVGRKFIPN
ncbi:Predicted membrane protein [Yersinia aldovae]|uniref:OpgC domain-containing protein n=1 Tax=Yersinia aldovae TaxID=29483 RepID=UPI0005E8C9B7|nr:OpgC domain-containing protein [Yersinia aldovae]CNH43361.1 Predicted membrane protein [Yersinia aldovae]